MMGFEPQLTMATVQDEIRARIEAGEFGDEPDINAIIEATAEAAKQERYITISGLWQARGKVAYEGRTQEELVIPPGSKILVFHNEKTQQNSPDYNLVYVG